MKNIVKLAALMSLGVAALLAAAAVDRNPLAAERWKTRPLIVVVQHDEHPLLENVNAALEETATQEAFMERDMVLYTVADGEGRRNKRSLAPDQTKALLKVLQLDPAGPATLVLVGKDGVTQRVEGADVDLKTVFATIDRMPMRQPR